MPNRKKVLSNEVQRFHLSAALIFTTLALVLTAATTIATAQTYTDLFNFGGVHGERPFYPEILAQGRDGNLYGTTSGGGDDWGVIFKITPSGVLTVLHTFSRTVDGDSPVSGLTLAPNGNFYGATQGGGNTSCDCGTVFEITPSGALTTLYTFTGGSDGASPFGPPIQASDGNFYGASSYGGPDGVGTIFELTPSGTFTALGFFPTEVSYSPLLQGADGNIYGIDASDYPYLNYGIVFKVTPKGPPTVIYQF